MIFYTSIILIILYYVLYIYFTRTFNYWKSRNVPGPPPVPFFGNLKDVFLRRKNIGVVFQELYDMFPNEKVVGMYRMTTPSLLVKDLDLIKHIMIKDFDVFMDRGVEFSTKGLGVNLFHSDGQTWRTLRSRFTPLFTSSKLRNMFHLMDECANKFIDHMQIECRIASKFEIHSVVRKFAIASISACAFGVDIDTLNDKLDTLIEVERLVVTPTYALEVDMLFPGILKKLNLSMFPKRVKNFFYDLTKNVVKQREGITSKRNDFVDLILELRRAGEIKDLKGSDHKLQISDDMIAAQMFIFYMAGYETSATTMTYLLHEIAVNQHIQDKLIAEIDESLAANEGNITYDSLKEMKYLDKVFSETLRKHSLVEPLQRMAKTDYRLPGTDIVVKKGQIVTFSVRGIHYDEKYYPNPEVFDPERFSREVVATRHPCAYMPFGIGPRNCIGERFGHIQSTLCIAKFLSKFRVELTTHTKKMLDVEPYRLIIGPKGGTYLSVIPRSK